jgi:glycosyltransferase involved in cell wall biosynthesis
MNHQISIIVPVRATSTNHVLWLGEALRSVSEQTMPDVFEVIVVDDHSSIDVESEVKNWHGVGFAKAEKYGVEGVSGARNLAVEIARCDLVLPLDADDKLAPNAVEKFLWAWYHGGKEQGIVYSDLVMFGRDYQQVYHAPEYNFNVLLHHNFMCVGCLMKKSDIKRAGGWNPHMDIGYEDWELFITLGELGVCGFHVSDTLYWYRRNQAGRLANIKAHGAVRELEAKNRMRDLHAESYNGRFTMGCCSEPKKARKPISKSRVVPVDSEKVQIEYTGRLNGSFNATAKPSGTTYYIPGPGALVEGPNAVPGVYKQDAPWFTRLHQGRDFRVIPPKRQPAKPARRQAAPATKPAPKKPAKPTKTVAMNPNLAVDQVSPVESYAPDPANFTVKQLIAIPVSPTEAEAMLEMESGGKNRKTVIAHLQSIISGK